MLRDDATRGEAAGIDGTVEVEFDPLPVDLEPAEGLAAPASLAQRAPADTASASPRVPPADPNTPAELHVLLVDASRAQPLAGWTGILRLGVPTGGGPLRESDAGGWLRFESVATGEPCELRVFVELGGQELARRDIAPLAPGERRELTIEIDAPPVPGYWFRVTAQEDGSALAGVSFRKFHLRQSVVGELLGVTDDAGLVRVEGAAGRLSLQLDAEGFAPSWVILGRGSPSASAPTALELTRPARLDVRLESVGGASVVGRKVVVHTSGNALGLGGIVQGHIEINSARWSTSAETGAEGVARFDVLPGQQAFQGGADSPVVRLDVGLRDARGELLPLVAESLILEPGEHRELVVQVGGEALVVGRVVDQFGVPVVERGLLLYRARENPEATAVFLDPDQVERRLATDADGRFEIQGVSVGCWELFVAALTRAEQKALDPHALATGVAPLGTVFEVDGSGRAVDVELVTLRGLVITGIALEASGAPITSGFVFGVAAAERHSVSVRLGEDGRFELGPLLEATYALTVMSSTGTGGDPVLARPGEDVTLQQPAMGELRARFSGEPDPMPQAVRYAWARVTEGGAPVATPFTTTAYPEFSIRATAAGIYLLAAWSNDGRFAYAAGVEVVGDRAADVVPLRLAAGGRVRVRVANAVTNAGEATSAPRASRLAVLRHGGHAVRRTYLKAGHPELLQGPIGAATAELWIDGELSESRSVTLVAGETVEVEFGVK